MKWKFPTKSENLNEHKWNWKTEHRWLNEIKIKCRLMVYDFGLRIEKGNLVDYYNLA